MSIERIADFEARLDVSAPYFRHRVPAGFPSPADDYMDGKLDLNEHLIQHPAATFFCRVSGESMRDIGIFDGDLLIVDRAVKASHGAVILAAVDGELTCKVLDYHQQRLLSANANYPPLAIHSELSLVIEGVVTHSIRHHRCSR